MIYPLRVDDRVISHPMHDDVIQNGIESDSIQVSFDGEWINLGTCRAVFANSEATVAVLFSAKASVTIDIPWEVLERPGCLYVTFVGYPSSDSRIVTRMMDRPFKVAPSGRIEGDEEREPTLDEAAVILEAVRQALEDVEKTNKEIDSAESARATAEKTRQSNESTRQKNETSRVEEEKKRAEAEKDRSTAETSRASAEEGRASAEKERQGNESGRQKSEAERAESEGSRAEAEAIRASEFDALKSQFSASVSASNAATLEAKAAAASVDEAIREAIGRASSIGDQSKAIDTLARSVCTSGIFVSGAWYVKASSVSFGQGRLTVHGSGLSMGRMLLPSTRCQASKALEIARDALSTSTELASIVSGITSAIDTLVEGLKTLARHAGSYPFRIGKSMYVRGVTYSSNRLSMPTASYEGGRMKISDM